jgi:hypothetical protein
MKNKYKMLAVTATAILSLSIAGQGFAAAGTGFQESNNTRIQSAVSALQKNGILKGDHKGNLEINATLTAAQGVQLIVNAFGLNLDTIRFFKEPQATDYFTKADNKAWYAQALIIASVHDLGLPKDLDPNRTWTKEEFTHYVMLAMQKNSNLPMIKLQPMDFKDEDQVNIALDGDVQRALVLGIAKLDADRKFNPKQEISRGAAAELIYNALEYVAAHPAPNHQS